jgi:hypothetical protein
MLQKGSGLLRGVGTFGVLTTVALVAVGCGSDGPSVSQPITSSTRVSDFSTTTTSTATSESSAIAEASTTTTSRPPRTTTSRPTTATTTTPTTTAPTTTTTEPDAGVIRRVLALLGAAVAALTGESTTTTTNTVPVSSSEEASAPWGWIIAVLLVGAVAAAVIILLNRRSRQRDGRAWRDKTRGTLEAAVLVERLLPTSGGDTAPAAHWEAVRTRVTDAAGSLERAAADAPTSEARRTARSCADALRAAVFATDADRLLREGGRSPTASELAAADVAIRQSSVAVHGALEALGTLVDPTHRPDGV